MQIRADYLGARWDAATQARFRSKVDKRGPDECWPWKGAVTPRGYGTFSVDNRHYAAHRLLIVKQRNDALAGLVCDHLCRNRACVNPRHLEAVSNRENIVRGDISKLNRLRGAAVTNCPRGHPYTPENTRLHPRGSRCCRACDKITGAQQTEKRKLRRARASGETE